MKEIAGVIVILIVAGCVGAACVSISRILNRIAASLDASIQSQAQLLLLLQKLLEDRFVRNVEPSGSEPAERFDPPDVISEDRTKKNEEARERARRFIEAREGDAD